MRNKLLSVVSFVILSFTLSTPIVINAETTTPVATSSSDTTISYQQTGKLKFNLLNGSLTVIGYVGDDAVIAIPSKYLGYTVTSISDKAFINDPNLTTLIIPTGIAYSDSIAPVIIEGDTEVIVEPSTITSSISTSTNTVIEKSTATVVTSSTCTITSESVDTSTVIATNSVNTSTASADVTSSTRTVVPNLSTATATSTVSKTYDETGVNITIFCLLFSTTVLVGVSPTCYKVISKIKSKRH